MSEILENGKNQCWEANYNSIILCFMSNQIEYDCAMSVAFIIMKDNYSYNWFSKI